MIYIAGTHLVDSSVRKILKLIKSNVQHSLWRICEAVCLLPERVHAASINEFKSSRAKLLTLLWVTMYFNVWKFVRVSYSNRLVLWKTYFLKVTLQQLFTDSKLSLVLMIFHMLTLIKYVTVWCLYQFALASNFWQRFCYIVL